MKQKKTNWVIVILVLLLLMAVLYIANNFYQEKRQNEKDTLFAAGAQYGYQQAVEQLIQQAVTCEKVPIFYKNQTLEVIAVPCLQTIQ